MASGCLLGECPICSDLIWEDEDIEISQDGIFYHKRCFKNLNIKTIKLYDAGELKNIKNDLLVLKDLIKFCTKEIERIENIITKSEGIE